MNQGFWTRLLAKFQISAVEMYANKCFFKGVTDNMQKLKLEFHLPPSVASEWH